MDVRSRKGGVAADLIKQATAPPRRCPNPLLVPAGVPLREYVRCLERQLAALRARRANPDRVLCDLERARQRLVLEPPLKPSPPSSSLVADTRISPLRFVCRIHARTEEGGHSFGTGLIIHPRIVLTSAHVIYPPQTTSKTISVEVTPGQMGNDAPMGGPFRADAWPASPGWDAGLPCEHDFALVRMPKAIGGEAWPIGAMWSEDVRGVDVYHAGYPDCPGGAPNTQMVRGVGQILGAAQYNGPCSIRDKEAAGTIVRIAASTRTIAHNIPTCPSQSGGPLWIVDVCSRKPVAVAIHQGRVGNGQFGRAIFFSETIFREIQAMMAALLK